jgi:hypothetical protein
MNYNIRAIVLAIALTIVANVATAQSEKVSVGIRAGIDFQNFNGKDQNGDALEFLMVPRFNAGVTVQIPIATDFFVQSGLLFSTKGAKSKENFMGQNMSVQYNLSYIELPIHLLYRPVLGNGHLLLGLGPYISYGVAGKAKYKFNNSESESKIDFTGDYESNNPFHEEHFKPLDFGGNLLFGYELAFGLSVQMNVQLGMAEINANNKTYPSSKNSYRNTGFGISLGYNF